MITMQITAPVGYGMRQMVAQLVRVRGLKAVWCSSLPEDRKRAEHSLGVPSITPRQFMREMEYGYKRSYTVVIVCDVSPLHKDWIMQYADRKDVELWLLTSLVAVSV